MQNEAPFKAPSKSPTFLEFLPVSIFGADMGLCALCFCWRLAYKQWPSIGMWPGEAIGCLAVLCFILLAITYSVKLIKYPALVKAEFRHEVTVCFFATAIISILLLPGVLLPYMRSFAIGLWFAGTILMFFFAWYVLRRWLDNKQQMENALPAWILPVVGTLDVPIVGNNLGLKMTHEYCLMFFGIGIIFALILLGIIISRLMFKPSLPATVQPTLLILLGQWRLRTMAMLA
jgi:tellurite resistance protein